MDGDENNQVTTPDNGAVMTSLLASLGLGAFQSVDALLQSDMDPEEFESPHIAAGRAAAAVSREWSLCRYFKCVWMVLGVVAVVGGGGARQENSNSFIKAAPWNGTFLEGNKTSGRGRVQAWKEVLGGEGGVGGGTVVPPLLLSLSYPEGSKWIKGNQSVPELCCLAGGRLGDGDGGGVRTVSNANEGDPTASILEDAVAAARAAIEDLADQAPPPQGEGGDGAGAAAAGSRPSVIEPRVGRDPDLLRALGMTAADVDAR